MSEYFARKSLAQIGIMGPRLDQIRWDHAEDLLTVAGKIEEMRSDKLAKAKAKGKRKKK